MKKIIFFTVMLLTTSFSFSQVGIGTQAPDPSTLLHVTNEGSANKGVLLAPMTTFQREKIINPVNGLMIYNTSENCLNFYNNSEWRSMCGDNKQAHADIDLNGEIKPVGDYTVGKPTVEGNYILLPITVIEEGSIIITVRTGNGYSFSYTNSLISEGNHMLKLPATGTPGADGIDIGVISINAVEVGVTPGITVKPAVGNNEFNVNCGSVSTTGVLVSGQSSTGSSIKVSLTNNSTVDAIYSLSTDVKNGVSFSGSGIVPIGQTVTATLSANGTPTQSGVVKFEIISNEKTQTPPVLPCTVEVTIAPKALVLYSNGSGNYSYGGNGTWKSFIENQANFGSSQSSKVKVGGISLYQVTNTGDVTTQLESVRPDIISISYNVSSTAAVNSMLSYAILNEIPVILSIENNEITALNNYEDYKGVFRTGSGISGNFTLNANVDNLDDILIYGPFSPAGGVKSIVKDGGGDDWLNYTSLPSTVVPYMTNGASIGMFRDDTNMILYCPDGGVLNQTGNEGTKAYFSNAIAWAVDMIMKK